MNCGPLFTSLTSQCKRKRGRDAAMLFLPEKPVKLRDLFLFD